MEQYNVLAIASADNERKLMNIIQDQRINCVGQVALKEDGIKKAIEAEIDSVVVMVNNLTRVDEALIERLHLARRNLVIILITSVCDMDTLTLAMEWCITKVLTADMDEAVIKESIVTEMEKVVNRVASAEKKQYSSKVFSVFGTKGGSGKTTLAVNLAVALRKSGKRVAIIDLDLQFGDVGVFLNVSRADTISDLVTEGDLSPATINSFLYKHASGLQVLCAPASPEYAEVVKPEHITKIVDALKGEEDYVIIDLGPTLDDYVLQALDISDTIYFITTPEISTLKNTKICMNVLEALGVAGKVKFILNKDGESYVKQKDMEEALDSEIVLAVPSEAKNTIAAINRGVPVVLSNPKSKVSKSILKYISNNDI